jgi:predicted glycosyltransferase
VKVLAYNSAARGTGQFVRSLKLAATIVSAFSDARCTLLVGSNYFPRQCPSNTTIVRLPEITKTLNGRAVCRTLNVERAFEIRQATIRSVISEFQPDVFLVDSRPLGLNGELLHSLQAIRVRGECKIMLILRDIVDEPALVKARWRDESVYEAIENLYDKVIFLGEESIYNAAEMYGLTSFGNKVIYVGYLGDRVTYVAGQRPPRHGSEAMSSVLVTVGGGYDGDRLVRALCCYIESIADAQRHISFKIVLGCNSPLSRKTLIAEYPRITRDAEIIASLDDLTALTVESDLVITMCGYNTLTEALAHRKKVIAVPRSHSGAEQTIRAEAVARAYDGIWVLPEDKLSIDAIGQALRSGLAAPPPRLKIEMSGNARLVALLGNEVQHARR